MLYAGVLITLKRGFFPYIQYSFCCVISFSENILKTDTQRDQLFLLNIISVLKFALCDGKYSVTALSVFYVYNNIYEVLAIIFQHFANMKSKMSRLVYHVCFIIWYRVSSSIGSIWNIDNGPLCICIYCEVWKEKDKNKLLNIVKK